MRLDPHKPNLASTSLLSEQTQPGKLFSSLPFSNLKKQPLPALPNRLPPPPNTSPPLCVGALHHGRDAAQRVHRGHQQNQHPRAGAALGAGTDVTCLITSTHVQTHTHTHTHNTCVDVAAVKFQLRWGSGNVRTSCTHSCHLMPKGQDGPSPQYNL